MSRTVVSPWLAFALLIPMTSSAQPAGSSPEAAFEAFEGAQARENKFIEVEEAKAQMVGPPCSRFVASTDNDAQQLNSCISTMESSLGWDVEEAFASCPPEGVARMHLEACASAITTFLQHHMSEEEEEAQQAFSVAIMKNVCLPSSLCSVPPEA